MKHGTDLQTLAQEVTRRRDAKRDFVVDTRHLTAYQYPAFQDRAVQLNIGDKLETGITKHAHRQIGQHLEIHAKYYDKMLNEAPDLLVKNINHWFQKSPTTQMTRTLDGDTRAFLSKSYRPLDNYDCLGAVYPPLERNKATLESCQITNSRMYIKATIPGREVEIKREGVQWGQGHNRIHVLRPGIVISNSEIGLGAVSIQPAIKEDWCSNLMVFSKDTARKLHVQKAIDIQGENVLEYITDATRRKADEAFWNVIKDLVEAALEGNLFDKYVEQVRASFNDEIKGNPVQAIEALAEKFTLSNTERDGVVERLIQSGDTTRFGVQAAITNFSQEVEDYDRATELEQLGGKLIELPKTEWETLALAA
jgi:hypothetical protein